jgi:hypothetical protein
MSHYVIEENLSTTREQKFASVGLSLIVSAVIIAFLYFMHIVVPNPPFEVKSGEVELDFGLQEVFIFSRQCEQKRCSRYHFLYCRV